MQYLEMDGDDHEVGNTDCPHCNPTSCEKCGIGLVHSQAVYGPSTVYKCDNCSFKE
jgi:hypothetical protein